MNRRDFMKGALVVTVAPAAIAQSVEIVPTPKEKIIAPPDSPPATVAELTIHSADGRVLGRCPLGYDGAPYYEDTDAVFKQPLKPLEDMVITESGYATHMTLEMPDPLDRTVTRKFHQPIQSHGFNLSSRQVMTGMNVRMTPVFVAI